MSGSTEEQARAATLPEDDVIGILLTQHGRVRTLFEDVKTAEGEHKQQAFDELRALLAVHETGEEMILRPVTKDVAGEDVANARNQEEEEANRVLAELEGMDVNSAEFATTLQQFEQAVLSHAQREETEEFPKILEARDEAQRTKMGKALRAAEKIAPTHPHPGVAGSTAGQWSVGPFASLVDRTRDAVKSATPGS